MPLPANRQPGSRPKRRARKHNRQADMWQAMLAHQGRWNVHDIARLASISPNSVRSYVRALARGGLVEMVQPSRNTQAGATPALYEIRSTNPETPMVHGEGANRIAEQEE